MKIKNWLRGLFMGCLITLGTLTTEKARAVDIASFFIKTPDCTTQIYRKPIGSIDTLETITDSDGLWVEFTENFDPPANLGDTLYVKGKKNGKTAKTMWIRGPPGENFIYDLNLDKFTGCIKNVIDTSKVNAPLNAIYNINSFTPCTTQVDTGIDQGWKFYYDVHAPFDTAQAVQGAQGNIILEKVVADTTWKTSIPFTVDRTRFDAQLIGDVEYFPQEKIVNDITPPTISNATQWPDTTFAGPYNVQWTRTDPAGISADSLVYKINEGTAKSASADSIKGDTAYATIDSVVATKDSVFYRVKSVDGSPNYNNAYWPSENEWHSFLVKDTVGIEEPANSIKNFKVWPSVGARFFSNERIGKIYDIIGRELGSNDYKITEKGNGCQIEPKKNGIYFLRSKKDEIKKVVRVK